MGKVENTIFYSCECYSYCDKTAYFRFEYDNAGMTTIYHSIHGEEETLIGVFNRKETEVLKHNL